MANNEKVTELQIPFPDFRLNEIIDPEQFDSNNLSIQDKLNDIVSRINAYLLSVDNNTPGNSYYTKNEIENLIEIGAGNSAYLDGGSFHDTYVGTQLVDGGSFEEELSDKLVYDGGEF